MQSCKLRVSDKERKPQKHTRSRVFHRTAACLRLATARGVSWATGPPITSSCPDECWSWWEPKCPRSPAAGTLSNELQIFWTSALKHDSPRPCVNRHHTVAFVPSSGLVYSFGCNSYGQLGTGTAGDARSPFPIKTNSTGNAGESSRLKGLQKLWRRHCFFESSMNWIVICPLLWAVQLNHGV